MKIVCEMLALISVRLLIHPSLSLAFNSSSDTRYVFLSISHSFLATFQFAASETAIPMKIEWINCSQNFLLCVQCSTPCKPLMILPSKRMPWINLSIKTGQTAEHLTKLKIKFIYFVEWMDIGREMECENDESQNENEKRNWKKNITTRME